MPEIEKQQQPDKNKKIPAPETPQTTSKSSVVTALRQRPWFALTALGLLALLIWSYAPTLARIETIWDANPDYSHGYLVVPLALFFLYLRRDSAPAWAFLQGSWKGLLLIGAALFVRYLSARLYIVELDGWSMILWLAGAVWIWGGWPLLRWCWGSIAFLVFMLPLPATVELLISNPLRQIATSMGTWGLQCCAQPAIQDGTTILLGDHLLDVERACSGLRMLFGVLALATAYIMIVRPPRWLSIALIISVFPVALLANAIRLVVTGLLFQYASDETAQKFIHDAGGWFMIPLAVAMFWALGLLLTKLTAAIIAAPQRGWYQFGKVVLAALALVVGIFGWHAYQQPRNISTLLARASALESEGKDDQVAAYLDRYLRLKPGDAEVAERLAKTFDRIAKDRTSRERLLKLYSQAAQLAPEKYELRLREAALAFELERPQQALPLTKSLLQLGSKLPAKDRAEVLRIQAGSTLLAAAKLDPETAAKQYAEAVSMLQEATVLNPQQLELTLMLAGVHLNYLKEPELAQRQSAADLVYEQLLKSNPDNPAAWLYAYRYWKARPNPKPEDAARAEQLLDQAIALNAKDASEANFEILLEASRSAAAKKDYVAARGFLESALAKFPNDFRGYAEMASLQLTQAEPDSQKLALATLKTGLEKTSPREWRLLLPLAAVQTDLGSFSEAQATIASLQSLLPFFNVTLRNFVQLRIEHLKAAALANQGKYGDAIDLLAAVLKSNYVPENASSELHDLLRPAIADAWNALGRYSLRLRNYENAAQAFQNAAQVGGRLESYVTAANVMEQSGDFAAAAQLYELAIRQSRLPEAWVGLARVQFQLQNATPPLNRNWTYFLRTLDNAPASANPVAFNALRAEYEAANGRPQEALAMLNKLAASNSDSPAIWEALALAQQRWGTAAESRRALAEYERLAKSDYQTAMLTSELFSREGDQDAAVETLKKQENSPEATAEQKQNLRYRLGVLMVMGKNRANGRKLLEELSAERADDLTLLESVARLSLEDQDWRSLEKFETKLRHLEGERGTIWRYFRANRLLGDNTKDGPERLREVQSLITELQALRPQWYKTSELQAIFARLQGDTDAAIVALQASLNHGNPNTRVAEEIVSMLLTQGRYPEAEQALNQVRRETANADWLNTVSVPLLIRKGKYAQAIELAKSWVESHPQDPMAYLRLGTSYLTSGQPDEATLNQIETAFKKAVELAPNDIRTWTMLFSYYVTLKKDVPAAKALATRFAEETGIERVQQKVVSAEFQTILGDSLQAAKLYQAACELAEQQPDARLKAMAFSRATRFFKTRDDELAFSYARKLRQSAPEVADSSLLLLQLLAERGGAEHLQEGFTVLKDLKKLKITSPALRKLETILLIVRGTPADRKAAIAQLEKEKLNQTNFSVEDRLRLANLYELEERLQPASELFAEVAARTDATPVQKEAYVFFLQRNSEKEPSFKLIEKRITKEMEQHPDSAFGVFRLRLAGLIATKESRLQNDEIIANTIRSYVTTQIEKTTDPKKQEQLLTDLLLILLGNDLQTEAELFVLATDSPLPESIRASALANAAAITGRSNKLSKSASEFLEQVVGRHTDNTELQFTLGNFHFMNGEYSQAEKFYRAALSGDSKNALVANNLAMSLSKQNKGIDEASKFIAQAIELGGRQPSFLDTQAAILSKQGNHAEAAKLWKEVLAARYRLPYALRLSNAFAQSGQTEAAKRELKKALASGENFALLSADDRQLLEDLKTSLKLE